MTTLMQTDIRSRYVAAYCPEELREVANKLLTDSTLDGPAIVARLRVEWARRYPRLQDITDGELARSLCGGPVSLDSPDGKTSATSRMAAVSDAALRNAICG